VPVAIIYARATKPTRPASRAMAGLLLLLAAPVKVATGTGTVVLATGATLLYQTLVLLTTGVGGTLVVEKTTTELLLQSLQVSAGAGAGT